jgi:hypothetical protein
MMGDVAVTITVDDAHLTQIDRIATELRRKGMQIDQVLNAVGAITGSVSDDRRQDLRNVDGVESVADATTFQLPPPDSPIQ